jgi:hypothetical protein
MLRLVSPTCPREVDLTVLFSVQKTTLSNQLRGYAAADGLLEACNLPKHRLEDIPAAKLIKKLQDFIATNLPPSPLNKEDPFPDIQYLDLRRSLRARQAWRAREVKRREELAAQMCKKAQRAWSASPCLDTPGDHQLTDTQTPWPT